MNPIQFVFLLESSALGVYAICAALLLASFIQWASANDEFENTTFELLREKAGERRHNAFLRMSALTLLMASAFVVQLIVGPSLRAAPRSLVSTPTPLVEVIPTIGPTPTSSEVDLIGGGAPEQPTLDSAGTPSPTPTGIGTIAANVPPLAGCDRPGAILQIPANGMEVREPFEVVGTADDVDFLVYRLELSGPSTGGVFAVLTEGQSPVTPFGTLGQLVPAAFEPGLYQLRLVVIGTDSLMRGACMVHIVVVGG